MLVPGTRVAYTVLSNSFNGDSVVIATRIGRIARMYQHCDLDNGPVDAGVVAVIDERSGAVNLISRRRVTPLDN